MVSIFVPHPDRLTPQEREHVRERYNRYLDDQTRGIIISGACMIGWTIIWTECEPALDKMLFDLGVGYLGIVLLALWYCYSFANEMKQDLNYLKQKGAIRFSDEPEVSDVAEAKEAKTSAQVSASKLNSERDPFIMEVDYPARDYGSLNSH